MSETLSVVIVTYNSSRDIHSCLEALTTHPPPLQHDVIVVDNASPDGTADEVRRRWPAVRVIDAGANVGFARANNIGIRASSGARLLLLNPDAVVTPGAISTLLDALARRPDAAAVGPRLLDERGWAELSFGRMIGPLAEMRQKVLVAGQRRGTPLLHSYVERATSHARTVDWVSGACILVRRADAEAVGLFDERYFMYVEDVDFCAALRARGRVVLFEPGARVVHARGRSALTAPGVTQDAYRRSQLAFYEKHRPQWLPLLRFYLGVRGHLPPIR